MSEETKTEETNTDEPKEAKSFDEFVKGLSPSQLAAAKATIDTVATER